MSEEYKNDYLSLLNPHERDLNIKFDAGPHIYTIHHVADAADAADGKKNKKYTSVTTWNHQHFTKFDSDAIITSMMKSKNWSKSIYYGKTREEIKQEWDNKRDEAAQAGTKLHYDIECYYNNNPVKNDSIEYQYFIEFLEATKTPLPLKSYRTEWMIYHEDVLLAGSVDMVYENDDGTLMIYDWKRSKEIKKTDNFLKFALTECIAHLPDTNFWHYSLQLNTYKKMIEEKYGKKVTKLCLVCLHPDNKNKSFQIIPVPDLQNELNDLFALRKKEINTTQ